MSDDCLHVDEVEIVRGPGYESGGFTVEAFSEGVTIVHGPNASGKTTTCRAIHELLWPGTVEPDSELVGRFRLNGSQWRVETRRGDGSHQQDGEPSNPPPLPAADERQRYMLSLHDLLDDDTRNESFAETIERETAGGYDVRAAADELGFDSSPSSRRISEVGAVEQAIDDVREARQSAEELRFEERRLATLESDLEDASAARDRVQLLEQAIEHASARDDLVDAEAELEAFPDVLEEVDGDEVETVEGYTEEIESLHRAKADAEETLEEARETLAETDLPTGGLDDGVLTELKERTDDLGSLESDRDTRRADLEKARRSRENALADIPVDVTEDDLRDLEPPAWEAIDEFAKQAVAVREDRATLESLERWYDGHEPPEPDRTSLEQAQQALEGWLKEPADAPGGRAPLRIGLVAGALFAVVGVALGFVVHPGFFGFVVLGAGLGAYGYHASGGGQDGSATASMQQQFDDSDIADPEEWTTSAVRQRLTEIYRKIAEHRFVETLRQRRDALTDDVADLEAREQEVAAQREELVERFGVAPDTSAVELLATTKGILRWQEHDDAVAGLEAEIEELEARIDEVRGETAASLEPYGYDSVPDAAAANGHVHELEERATAHAEAERELEDAAETIENVSDEIAELESKRAEIYKRLELDPGSQDALSELCERAEEYQSVDARVDRLEAVVERERDKLEAYPEFDPELAETPVPELRSERRDAEETAAAYDELSNAIGQIEGRIDAAKSGTELEDAYVDKRRALADLEAEYESDTAAMVGQVLADHVREATSEATRPAVFQHARERLARITAGRYSLVLDEGGDFRAVDTVQEKGYALEQLSSATRLQVLLAVRVAFVQRQEQGPKLPLLLDETLANSDDRKAEVIIDAMIELARDGRQIVYFTAQGDEVAKWEAALEATDQVPYEICDLADEREHEQSITVPDGIEDWTTPTAPDPDGRDHDEYGAALGVGSFDPRVGASSGHLWYLIDDPELLSGFLEQGVDTWGQFETLAEHLEPAVFGCDEDRLAEIERYGEALETYVEAWEHGRGEPLTREVLEDSGAITSNFIDEVSDLADSLDGDGERIVDSLRAGEVKRFRRDNAEELRTYLEEEGYIEDAEPLAPEEIRLRVVNSYVSGGVPPEGGERMADALLDRLAGPSS